MATYLLDTHTIIWYLSGDSQLSSESLAILENTNNKLFISIVSYWEMAIKISIGKLELPVSLSDFINLAKEKDIETANLTEATLINLLELPLHHRDPFDRAIISHAVTSKLSIISKDGRFDAYDIERIW